MLNAIAIPARHEPNLFCALKAGWARIQDSGGIEYDVTDAQSFTTPAFAFLHVPGRLKRPGAGAPTDAKELGLLKSHRRCPFDEPENLTRREVLRFTRDGRSYFLIANKYPVKELHFLTVRPFEHPSPDELPQCIFSAEEIEDMLLLCRSIGPPMAFFFNSNAGADGSDSGSSINHWHFQLFPDSHSALARGANLLATKNDASNASLFAGQIPDWDVPHRMYRSSSLEDVAARLWEDVRRARDRDIAFNLIFQAEPGDSVSAAFFARAPVTPLAVSDIGELSRRFGGFEVTGSAVIYQRGVYAWLKAHPREAEALAWQRLRAGLTDVWAD